MSFRRRMVLLAAGAVAAAIVIASVVVYIVTRNELSAQLDASLRAKITPGRQVVKIETHLSQPKLAQLTREGKLPALPSAVAGGFGVIRKAAGAPYPPASASETAVAPGEGVPPETFTFEHRTVHVPKGAGPVAGQVRLVLQGPAVEGTTGYVQLSLVDGEVLGSSTGRKSLLPITAATRAVASGSHNAFFTDVNIRGTPVRVLTARAAQGAAWQVALPLANLKSTLDHLRLVLAIVVLGGIALAAALGLLVSRAALVPVRRLTGAAERVARTQDLGHRIAPAGQDELGRLSASFNTMLAALERSRMAQRQLVSDASHELRTPLTSIRANLDALALGEQLPAAERTRVLAAAQAQLHELTVLVGDLVDLSKNEVEEIEVEDVRLDLATASAIERARLHAPHCRFELDAEPCLVRAAPARLDRAIANLLDNAVKWTPVDGAPDSAGEPTHPIEVRVRDGRLEVRDHGPGIAEEDLPRVFDRFYRAPAARGRPGAGLGLAIVRQTAEAHGGTVHAGNDPEGGARLTLELPALPMSAAERAHVGVRVALTTLVLGGVLLIAGCGGSSSPGVARVSSAKGSGNTGAGSASSSSASPASPEQAMLAFAKCMRSNGVPNFPDPTSGGFIVHGVDPSSPAFQAARAKCQKLMPGGGPPGPGSTTNPSPQTLARFLKVAQCMRKHGIYNFPDPRTSVPSNPFGSGGGSGVISDIEGVVLIFPSTIDQSSPQFTQAAAACAFPLHNH